MKYRSYAQFQFGSELEKISRVYLYSECYSNEISKRLPNCPLKRVNNLSKKVRQWIKRLAHVLWINV